MDMYGLSRRSRWADHHHRTRPRSGAKPCSRHAPAERLAARSRTILGAAPRRCDGGATRPTSMPASGMMVGQRRKARTSGVCAARAGPCAKHGKACSKPRSASPTPPGPPPTRAARDGRVRGTRAGPAAGCQAVPRAGRLHQRLLCLAVAHASSPNQSRARRARGDRAACAVPAAAPHDLWRPTHARRVGRRRGARESQAGGAPAARRRQPRRSAAADGPDNPARAVRRAGPRSGRPPVHRRRAGPTVDGC